MASNPPGQCCTVGAKHEGKPEGQMQTIDGIEAYVAVPKPEVAHAGLGIVFLTDVIGHRFNNAQLLADQFAANGYVTVVPDLFAGDAIPLNRPEGFDFMGWLGGKTGKEPHDPPHVDPYMQSAIKLLKEEHGVKKVGAVGYCFGAKYVVRGMGRGEIDVGWSAHPSFVEEEELEKIKGPFSISAAETDQIFTTEKRHKSESILQGTGQPWQINLFSGVEHGFAVRGDIGDKKAKFAKEQAFCQAVVWFDTWLKQ